MTSLTLEACKPTGAKPRDAERSKNFFALGLLSWLYHRPILETERWIAQRYGTTPVVVEANTLAFRAGYNFGETAEIFESSYEIAPAEHLPGTYTNVTGNAALAWGLLAAAQLAKLPLFLGSYPITPASDILHELSKHKNFGVRTLQAEDEIAGIGAALGAAFGGALGVTTTSGPGIDLKAETVGLAVSLELPLLIVDIQRGGPSTGLPTKTEQSDLLHAMFGRHGEAPCPDRGRQDAFALLRRGDRGGADRAQVPDAGLPALRRLPRQRVGAVAAARRRVAARHLGRVRHRAERDRRRRRRRRSGRTCETPRRSLGPGRSPARPASSIASAASRSRTASAPSPMSPRTTRRWSTLRAAKIAGIAKDLPPVEADDPTGDAKVLLLGWGSTYAAITAGVKRVRKAGKPVAQVHLVHLNPFPPNLGEVLRSYDACSSRRATSAT